MFCEKKKSKCPKKNFQSVERGKNVSVEFRVFGKKRKVPEKKKSVLGGNFAEFVFTGWTLCEFAG